MSTREDGPSRWRSEPEVSSASGGHFAPDLTSEEPFDPLTAPLPSELARQEYERERSRRAADVIPGERPARSGWEPSPAREPTPPPRQQERRPVRRRPAARRVRRTVRHVDPFSVLKLALFYNAVFLLLWLIFVWIVYSFVDAKGWIADTESFVTEGFVLQEKFDLSLVVVEKWAFVVGLTMAIIGSLLSALMAFLYNVGADALGGVEMTFVERDL